MNQPKVSVIIPVYNVEKYLNRCIGSIVNQTYTDLEIILVDDGSPDNCPQMCDEWALKDSRIKVIHKENSGAGLARNTGLENATGDYVTFVDSDDYIAPETVEKCVEVLLKNGSQLAMFGRVDVSYNGRQVKKPVKTDKILFENKEIVCDILPGLFVNERGFGVGVCGKIVDLNVIKSHGLRFNSERELLSEDAYFLLELFTHLKSVSLIPENYYYYVQNENSFSRTYKKNYQAMNDNFITRSIELCEKIGYSGKIIAYLKARYQIYSLAGMKQIVACGLTEAEKNRELKAVIGNKTLQSTLTKDVLALCNGQSRLFWLLVKCRCTFVCKAMLKYKTRN